MQRLSRVARVRIHPFTHVLPDSYIDLPIVHSQFVPLFIVKHMQQADEATDQAERSRHSMAPSQVSAPTPARPSEPPVTSPHRQLPPQDTAVPTGNAEAKENEANNFPRYAQKEDHDQATSDVLVSSDLA